MVRRHPNLVAGLGLAIAFLFIGGIARSQTTGLTISVDRTTVSMDQQVRLTIEVQNADKFPDADLTLDAFVIVGGPAQSSSYQWINGKATSSKTLIYTLEPKKIGQFTIGPLVMQYKGRRYTSNKVTITVTPAASGQGNPTAPSQSQSQANPPASDISDVINVRAIPEKTTAYPGEQINVTYKLYTRVSVRNYSIEKQADAVGFWKEEINTPQNPMLSQEVIHGFRYNTAVIKRMAYFPTKSGDLTIAPLPVTVEVQASRQRNMFGDFFTDPFSRTVTKLVTGNPILISVRPLPEEGKPAFFAGAVGDYTLTASLDTTETQINDAVGLSVVIQGTGNLPMVTLPKITPPDSLDMFDPEIEKNTNFVNGRLSGRIKYQYVFIPRKDGNVQLPEIQFSYFNPKTEQYHTLSSPTEAIMVHPAAQPNRVAGNGFSREEVKLINQDVRYLKPALGGLHEIGLYYYGRWQFYLTLLFSLAIFGASLGYRYWYEHWGQDTAYMRRRHAMKRANEHIQQAARSEQTTTHYSLLSRAILGFIGDKCNLSENALNTDQIVAHLHQRTIPEATVKETEDLLGTLNAGRFAPNIGSDGQSRELDTRAKTLLRDLNKYL